MVLLPVTGPQRFFALYLLTLHAERRRWIIEWGLRAGTLLTAAGIFAWVATVAVWISLGIGQIVLVLLPVMGLQLHLSRRCICSHCMQSAGGGSSNGGSERVHC